MASKSRDRKSGNSRSSSRKPKQASSEALEPQPEAVPEATLSALPDVADEKPVDLPFIIDIPREVPVEADSAPESVAGEASDLSATPTRADEWVDQVLEPTKNSARSPRARETPTSLTPAAARTAQKASVTLPPKPAVKGPEPASRAPAKATADGGNRTRWWLVAPVFLVAAVLLIVNRPGQRHAPVPAGVLGTWTTSFWLYEHQTLEIKADTVVATLDEPEEGRFPITKVETSDAGREVAVKISYRNPNGEEKVLDFLADKEPTTALRFRAHSGLVWVKPE